VPQIRERAIPQRLTSIWLVSLFSIPLLLSLGPSSLMAQDEGYYALQARWILDSGDWLTPQWWGAPIFDRTLGTQWLMALSLQLFGLNDWAIRLPALLAGVASVGFTCALGQRLLPSRPAVLGGLLLSLMPLWLRFAHQATQDLLLLAIELWGLWALVSWFQTGQRNRAFQAGLSVGLAFLVKGFMVAVPVVALLPLFWHYRHRLKEPWLWLGLGLGGLAVLGWLGGAIAQHGWLPVEQLVGKLFQLSQKEFHPSSPLFYVWNLPLGTLPWFLAAFPAWLSLLRWGHLLGTGDANRPFWQEGDVSPEQSRLLGLLLGIYPLLLFLLLSLFRTRTVYYALQLTPMVALQAAVSFDWLARGLNQPASLAWRWAQRSSWAAFGLGCIGVGLGLLVLMRADLRLYAGTALLLGLSWLLLPRLAQGRAGGRRWLGAWLLGPWLGVVLLNGLGGWSNFSPALKAAVTDPAVHRLLAAQPVHFVAPSIAGDETQKQWILLGVYTPRLGRYAPGVEQLPPGSVAWVSPELAGTLPPTVVPLVSVQNWTLVRTKV
jgi:4-amino-4-deoxy-L-arabinose transferase-like glycosyltransferase